MFEIFLLLQDIMRLSHKSLRNNLKPYGLFKGQPKILGYLSHHDMASKKDIADRFNIAMPTVTKTIERLEKNDFVKTTPDRKDKRKKRVSLTKKGIEVDVELVNFKKAYAHKIFKDINKEDLDHFEKVLLKLKSNMLEISNEKND